jgi:hypothetical protein
LLAEASQHVQEVGAGDWNDATTLLNEWLKRRRVMGQVRVNVSEQLRWRRSVHCSFEMINIAAKGRVVEL